MYRLLVHFLEPYRDTGGKIKVEILHFVLMISTERIFRLESSSQLFNALVLYLNMKWMFFFSFKGDK